MNSLRLSVVVIAAGLVIATPHSALAANVKVTPLGSHDGEFCKFDRAMIFEDPDGTRLLYDAGRTVAGPDDPRLGKIDVVLVSHMHGDHAGDRHISKVNGGECGKPDISVKATPNTNSVNIVLAKGAKIITGSEMPRFLPASSRPSAEIPRIRNWCASAHRAKSAVSPSRRFPQSIRMA